MLKGYSQDMRIEMDTAKIAFQIYSFTSGYPYLVSRICKLMDEHGEKIEKKANDAGITPKEYVDNTIDAVNEVKLTKVVQWDNAQEGTTTAVTTNMVVLTEEEYESLDVKIPNAFYFIYDNDTEGAVLNDN